MSCIYCVIFVMEMVLLLIMLLLQFSFFRQFFISVGKADYLAMRHGFITVSFHGRSITTFKLNSCLFHFLCQLLQVHLAPGSKFDFQKYIERSLEDDFKVVVGIRYVINPEASLNHMPIVNLLNWLIIVFCCFDAMN